MAGECVRSRAFSDDWLFTHGGKNEAVIVGQREDMLRVAGAVRITCGGLGEKPKALDYGSSTGSVDEPEKYEILIRNFAIGIGEVLEVCSVGEDVHRYLGALFRQQVETGKLDLSAFTTLVQGKLLDAVSGIASKR